MAPDAYLCGHFNWMRVGPLVKLLEQLIEIRETRRITPDVFRRAVLDEVGRRQSVYKSVASLTAVEESLPGLLKGLRLLAGELSPPKSEELSKRKIGWAWLAELGKRVRENAGGKSDYLESLGQLLTLAPDLKWLLSRQKVVEAKAADMGRRKATPEGLKQLRWLLGRQKDARSRPKFCPMCWRFAVFDTKYCAVHTPSKGNTMGQTEKHDLKSLVKHGDCYSYARRLQPRFLANLKKIQAADRREKRKHSWSSAIDGGQMIGWLASFRPNVLVVFSVKLRSDARDPLAVVAAQLDRVPGSHSRSEVAHRQEFHAFLTKDSGAVFEATQRAEAWLAAASEARSNWGGTRRTKKYPREVRERAVRLVLESGGEHRSQWAAIASIAEKVGCSAQTLSKWVRQYKQDAARGKFHLSDG